MEELKITELGTIKGKNFTEVSIDKFLNTIEKGVKEYSLSFDKGSNPTIVYDVAVYKSNEEDYTLYYKNIHYTNGGLVPYKLKCDNEPYLNSKLTHLSAITAKNDYEVACYNKITSGSKSNEKEKVAYMNYLTKMNKYCSLKTTLPISIFTGSLLVFASTVNFWLTLSSWSIEMINWVFPITMISSIVATLASFRIFPSKLFWHSFKAKKMIKRNMKLVKKKLGNVNIKDFKYEKEKVEDNIKNENDIYRDKVIDKMNDIYNLTSSLSEDDCKKVLYELKKMQLDYATDCQEVAKNKKHGLTLEDAKRKLIMDTLSKMTDLEMTIFEMKKNSSSPENKTLLSDSDKLMKKIDQQLKEMDNEQVMMTSDGKMVSTSSPKR